MPWLLGISGASVVVGLHTSSFHHITGGKGMRGNLRGKEQEAVAHFWGPAPKPVPRMGLPQSRDLAKLLSSNFSSSYKSFPQESISNYSSDLVPSTPQDPLSSLSTVRCGPNIHIHTGTMFLTL